jgi:hypothetical protein
MMSAKRWHATLETHTGIMTAIIQSYGERDRQK